MHVTVFSCEPPCSNPFFRLYCGTAPIQCCILAAFVGTKNTAHIPLLRQKNTTQGQLAVYPKIIGRSTESTVRQTLPTNIYYYNYKLRALLEMCLSQ